MLKIIKNGMLLDTEQRCAWCDGSGYLDAIERKCPFCEGDGMLRIDPAIVKIMKSSGHWDSNNEVDASLMHDMGVSPQKGLPLPTEKRKIILQVLLKRERN